MQGWATLACVLECRCSKQLCDVHAWTSASTCGFVCPAEFVCCCVTIGCNTGQRAPQSLFLGVANSGRSRHGQVGQRHSCEVTVYPYYWVANSSRCPLFFWDRPLDSPSEFLDYSSMVAPGSVYGTHPQLLIRNALSSTF